MLALGRSADREIRCRRPALHQLSDRAVLGEHAERRSNGSSAFAQRAGQARGHGAALYLHIPFCRALCTFCGCNTRITRSHSIVPPYMQALLAELDLYLRSAAARRSWNSASCTSGGGTPTFLTAAELESLLAGLFQRRTARARVRWRRSKSIRA